MNKYTKSLGKFALLFAFSWGFSAFGQTSAHAKHNMVLFGGSEVFASHIVYKQPHNYQVILSLQLSPEEKAIYLKALQANPQQQFIYLLDHMDIKDIASVDAISGTVFYYDEAETKQEVIASLKLTKENFRIIYFSELPLSLEGSHH